MPHTPSAVRTVASPVGPLLLVANDDGLTGVYFETSRHGRPDLPVDSHGSASAQAMLDEAARQLDAYFRRTLREFALPLSPAGTAYQKKVWDELRRIPYGETRSYGDIAFRIGSVARAVGNANGLNPIPIIVPCHRVIGSDGSLVGFGGGLPAKRWLLDHERPPQPSLF
jgi:methylated-DNA-[protein]-cysteine S-methyltransferase